MPIILKSLMVFAFKTLEVTLTSLKVILITRKKRLIAAVCALFESAIWALIVSNIIQDLTSNIGLLAAYCLGNAIGNLLGSIIEEKIALGYVRVAITSEYSNRENITEVLHEYNAGFTVAVVEGEKDTNCDFAVIIKRKLADKMAKEIRKKVPNCFISIADITKAFGGH